MKRFFIWFVAITPVALFAQAAPSNMQEAAAGSLTFAETRITQLAEAIPEDKFDWRPAEGVRSVGEVLLHVASANYFLVMTAGHTPPEGVDIMSLESSVKGKENIIAAVKESFAYAIAGVSGMSDDALDTKVEFPFPGEYNGRSAMMIVSGHGQDHMGTLIAYARMNGITPPWSE